MLVKVVNYCYNKSKDKPLFKFMIIDAFFQKFFGKKKELPKKELPED
jgi:hypothetical protein